MSPKQRRRYYRKYKALHDRINRGEQSCAGKLCLCGKQSTHYDYETQTYRCDRCAKCEAELESFHKNYCGVRNPFNGDRALMEGA